jgi:hypothetical protein
MIRVTVYALPIRNLKGTSKTTNRPYDLHIQTAYAHALDTDGNALPVPEKFEIVLDNGQPPYAPGDYTLHPSALYVDRDGRLAVAPRLQPLKSKAAA